MTDEQSKHFVLDTNVLLHSAAALFAFKEHHVVLPIDVIEELDRFKNHGNELGFNARSTIRSLDGLRARGRLTEGVPLNDEGGTLRIDLKAVCLLDQGLSADIPDHRIVSVAYRLKQSGKRVVFVSKDMNLRIKSDALGLETQDFLRQTVRAESLSAGWREVQVADDLINALYKAKSIEVPEAVAAPEKPSDEDAAPFTLNEGALLRSDTVPRRTALAIHRGQGKMSLVERGNEPCFGIQPRNLEQRLALELLLDPSIHLVSLVGKAGTGKTLLAMVAGLQQILNEGRYESLLVARPIMPLGRDIGFLPGKLTDKLEPWMKPIFDNLQFVLRSRGRNSSDAKRKVEELLRSGHIEMEAITYIRGRSIHKQFLIIDECFPYATPILTEEGPRQIGALFSRWIQGRELPRARSFDERTGRFVWKPIIRMWHRGQKPLIAVRLSNRKIRCTANHPFLTNRGWVEAGQLRAGDLVVASHPEEHQTLLAPTEAQNQLLLGSFLGDGSISPHGKARIRLRVTHGQRQRAYRTWKASLFSREVSTVQNAGYQPDQPKFNFTTTMFGYPREFPYPKTSCPQWTLDELDERGLAIWFMDDGSVSPKFNHARLHTESFDEESVYRMARRLKELGVETSPFEYSGYRCIRMGKQAYRRLSGLISPWCHSSMAYKIHPEHRSRIGKATWPVETPEWGYVAVKGIEGVDGLHHVFDMEVEDTHNFLIPSPSRGAAGGRGAVVVHNCQNLTPHEVKTIISRAGGETKIVLTGDPYQIDNPYLDTESNGLTYVAERMKTLPLTGHVLLAKTERSPLASAAADVL